MFWAKVVCEQCNKKVRASQAIYCRGSQFCSEACIAAWSAANPSPVAKGDPNALRTELDMLVDAAHEEYHRYFDLGPYRRGTAQVALDIAGVAARQVLGGVARINAEHEAQERQQRIMLYHTHLLRSVPILRALGYLDEANDIERIDLMKLLERGELYARVRPLMGKLAQIRG